MEKIPAFAHHFVNTGDDAPMNAPYRILAVILSSVPAETTFGRGEDTLYHRLHGILKEDVRPLVVRNFSFDGPNNGALSLETLLSAELNYGAFIGLKNSRPDYRLTVTHVTHAIANEAIERGLIPPKGVLYLRELGKRLLPSE